MKRDVQLFVAVSFYITNAQIARITNFVFFMALKMYFINLNTDVYSKLSIKKRSITSTVYSYIIYKEIKQKYYIDNGMYSG